MEQLSPTQGKRVINTIVDLTFGDYIKAVLGDTIVLALSEDVTTEELTLARKMIMAEFAEATGNYEFASSMNANKKLMLLNCKIMLISLAEKILISDFSEDTFQYLKDHKIIGKRVKYPNSTEELTKLLTSLRVTSEITSVDIREIEVRKEKEINTKVYNVTKKDFIKLLASVSQYVKFNIDFSVNCAVVAEHINSMRVYRESMENKNVLK